MGTKINRMNLTEEIYRIVKEDILSHKLTSGEKINIDQLARSLEVSNIPIREALSRLQSEGYLHMVPYKGMFVNLMNLQQLNELYEIRLNLEPLAVEKAALKIPDEKLVGISENLLLLHPNKPLRSSDGLETVAKMNASIHGTILAYCDNRSLQNLIRGYIEQIQRYLTFIELKLDVDNSEVEWSEHHAILQKLMERDAKGASEAMSVHISNSQSRTNIHFRHAEHAGG